MLNLVVRCLEGGGESNGGGGVLQAIMTAAAALQSTARSLPGRGSTAIGAAGFEAGVSVRN